MFKVFDPPIENMSIVDVNKKLAGRNLAFALADFEIDMDKEEFTSFTKGKLVAICDEQDLNKLLLEVARLEDLGHEVVPYVAFDSLRELV